MEIKSKRPAQNGLWERVVARLNKIGPHEEIGILGDFTTTPRMIVISLFAIVIGVISAFVAWILLRLIGIFTNLFFFQRWGTDLVSPAGNKLGVFEILVPVVGALIIGFMARYGSERIRGHGIPEAIEAILINGSKIDPKVAILKPISSAISIGSGGPFGAEGPIIMTGGAIGDDCSILSPDQCRTQDFTCRRCCRWYVRDFCFADSCRPASRRTLAL